jgi:competence transcription factor ComK
VCVFVKYIKDRKSTDYNHMSVTFNTGKGFTHPEFEHK